METKKCPFCGEDIRSDASKCPICGEELGNVFDKSSPLDVTSNHASQRNFNDKAKERSSTPSRKPDATLINESQSFFKLYFVDSFLKPYADFKGCISKKDFWLTVLAVSIVTIGVYGVCLLLMNLHGITGILLSSGICTVYGLGIFIPWLAVCCRRLRDACYNPWLILLEVIPVIGIILLIYYFCQPSKHEHREQTVRINMLDYGIIGGSVILFVLGIVLLGGTTAENDSDGLTHYEGSQNRNYYDNNYHTGRSGRPYSLPSSDNEVYTSLVPVEITPGDSINGFHDGPNHLHGFILNPNGWKYPFTLEFVYNSSKRSLRDAVYCNYKLNTKLELKEDKTENGVIKLVGQDGGKDFIIQFSGNNPYEGEIRWGLFHQDIELK